MRKKIEYRLFPFLLLFSIFFNSPETTANVSQRPIKSAIDAYNLNPALLGFGIPSLQTQSLERPWKLSLQTSIANQFSIHIEPREAILLDGELTVSRLSAQLKWKGMEPYISVPHISHDGGGLDGLIVDWHDWFHLPQSDRDSWDQDELDYIILQDGYPRYEFSTPSESMGDIRLGVTLPFENHEQPWLLQLEMKLPTGKADIFTGSGATDFTLGAGTHLDAFWDKPAWSVYGAAAVSYLGDADYVWARRQNHWATTARLGTNWLVKDNLAAKLQLDHHSPIFERQVKELGTPSLQLTLALSFQFSERWNWRAGFAEDLITTVTPDFVVFSSISFYGPAAH